jgi:signal transduction histidine kinase
VVYAGRRRLTQALLQLADNAAKHTSEGDTIEIGAGTAAGALRLWVDDCGRGVSEEDAERIFERFGRGAGGPATAGAGLGLAIVSAIAEAHGGAVALVPRPGPGARFEITLPLR